MEYITASCVIIDNSIYHNGRLLFRAPRVGLQVGLQVAPQVGPRVGLPEFLLSAYQHFGFQYPKFYKMDQLSKLGWLAAELLLGDRSGEVDYLSSEADYQSGGANYRPEEMAVVLSNANSSLDTDYKYFATVGDIPSPALFVYTLPNIMIGEICIRHKFKGENAFFVFETFDAGFIETYVRDLMETGNARACVCGWVDVLGEDYSAALFLIGRESAALAFTKEALSLTEEKLAFTAENMNRLFNIQHDRHE